MRELDQGLESIIRFAMRRLPLQSTCTVLVVYVFTYPAIRTIYRHYLYRKRLLSSFPSSANDALAPPPIPLPLLTPAPAGPPVVVAGGNPGVFDPVMGAELGVEKLSTRKFTAMRIFFTSVSALNIPTESILGGIERRD
jgi:hypothetical protein